jgi:cell division protein FtsW (lipid II flippase)
MSEENKKQDFTEEDDLADFTAEINQNIDDIRTSTDHFFKRKLISFCIRWTITLVLLYIFLDSYPWIKYLMYLAIPLGILNLVLIFGGRKKINEKLSETEDNINSL